VVAGDARIVFEAVFRGRIAGRLLDSGQCHWRLRSSPILEAEFDRTGRSWGFNYKVTGIGPDFESQAGFVPATMSFKPMHSTGSRSTAQGRLPRDGKLLWGPSTPGCTATFCRVGPRGPLAGRRRLRFVVAGVGTTMARLGSPISRPGRTTRTKWTRVGTLFPDAPTGVDNWVLQTGVSTPTWQTGCHTHDQAKPSANFCGRSGGNETRVTGSLDLRPTGSIRISGSNTYS
jgi:hypothetical protein